jgi:hypothetical protein
LGDKDNEAIDQKRIPISICRVPDFRDTQGLKQNLMPWWCLMLGPDARDALRRDLETWSRKWRVRRGAFPEPWHSYGVAIHHGGQSVDPQSITIK